MKAVTEALNSPLLNDNNIAGARNILVNITSGKDEITMDEIGQVTDYIQSCAGDDADLIWGNGVDEALGDSLCVTIIATGFGTNSIPELYIRKRQMDKVSLDATPPPPVYNTDKSSNEEFEVKDKPQKPVTRKRAESNISNQREIEFEISDGSGNSTRIDDSAENQRASERVKNIKMNYEKMQEMGLNSQQRQISIDDMENQPAYVRRNFELEKEEPSKEKKISRYSLTDDEKKSAKLSDNNRYLHENVD